MSGRGAAARLARTDQAIAALRRSPLTPGQLAARLGISRQNVVIVLRSVAEREPIETARNDEGRVVYRLVGQR